MKLGTKDCIKVVNFGKLKFKKIKSMFFRWSVGLLFKSTALWNGTPQCAYQVWQGVGLKQLVPPQCGHGHEMERCSSWFVELSPAMQSLRCCYVLIHQRLSLHGFWPPKVRSPTRSVILKCFSSLYPQSHEIRLYFYSVETSDILCFDYLKKANKSVYMTLQLCASHTRNIVFWCVKYFRFEFCIDKQNVETDQYVDHVTW